MNQSTITPTRPESFVELYRTYWITPTRELKRVTLRQISTTIRDQCRTLSKAVIRLRFTPADRFVLEGGLW